MEKKHEGKKEKVKSYIVRVQEGGIVQIPEPIIEQCPWIKTHIIDVTKVTEKDGSWKLILKPGKKHARARSIRRSNPKAANKIHIGNDKRAVRKKNDGGLR